MMSKLPRSHQENKKTGFWLLNPANKIESLLLSLFFLLLPTQLGKHFWPDFTLVSGIRIDYLSPTVYVTDLLLILLFGCFFFRWIKTLIKSKFNPPTALRIKNKKHFFVICFIVLFFMFNIVFSARPLLSFYGFVKIGGLTFLIFYLAKTIGYRFQLQLISGSFAVSAIGESLLAIFQYLHQGSLNGIFYF